MSRITFTPKPEIQRLSLEAFLEKYDLQINVVEGVANTWWPRLVGAQVKYKEIGLSPALYPFRFRTNSRDGALKQACNMLTTSSYLFRENGENIDIRNVEVVYE